MAITALHSAATGLSALSTEIDVIANNLANVNTIGFKAAKTNFEDLLYQERAQPGVQTENGERPSGLYVGLGTRISNTQFDFNTIGSPVPASGDLDMMIDGPGLFQVEVLDAQGESGIGYTRAGNFTQNSEGDVVLGNADGPRLTPALNIPEGTTKVEITADGRVMAFVNGQTQPQELVQLQLATFVNPGGLKPIGGNLFVETAASGPPITGTPGEGSFGIIKQRYLEASNVEPVTELVSLIKTQRAFELNSQTIQAADEALQVISNLRRF